MRKISAFGAAAALGLGMLAMAAPPTGAADVTPGPGPTVETFSQSGTWTVPEGVRCVTFTAVGAQGGTGGSLPLFGADAAAVAPVSPGGTGGLGGEVVATFVVTPGASVDLGVGVRGADGVSVTATAGPTASAYGPHAFSEGGAGGALGGGAGGEGEGASGGGGGGASTVSLAGAVVMVAAGGGGGGAGYDETHPGQPGGDDEQDGTDGLPADEFDAAIAGGGATTIAGGAAGTNTDGLDPGIDPTAGTLTNGGTGGTDGDGGGGGGGGLYGGGGGGGGWASGGSGGGGGSNLVPAGGSVAHGVLGSSFGDGLISAAYTPGDLSCGATAPAAVVTGPRFTG